MELVENQIYFLSSSAAPNLKDVHVFNVDNSFRYDGYNSDFGPLHLGDLHKFCSQASQLLNQHRAILLHCGSHQQRQTNAAYFMACYLLICHDLSVQ